MLKFNEGKREDPNAQPVYLVIKRREKEPGTCGRKTIAEYAPKIIWANNGHDIMAFLRKLTGQNDQFLKLMIVANAREASTCSPNQDVDILDHLNIAEIKCLVAYF